MKKITLLLLSFLAVSTSYSQTWSGEQCYPLHIKQLKIENDGLAITLNGRTGNRWASNPVNAKKIAREIIKRYKSQGGKKELRVKNLTVEIQIHATLYITGKFTSRASEINTVWSDLTKPYSTYKIASRIYAKLKTKLNRKVTQKDIYKIVA